MVDELLKEIGGGINTVARAPEVYQKGLLFEEYFWIVIVFILLLVTIIILQIRRSSCLGNNRIRICPSCGVQNPVNSQFCSECGEQFYVAPAKKPKPKTRVCPNCRKINPPGVGMCLYCDHVFSTQNTSAVPAVVTNVTAPAQVQVAPQVQASATKLIPSALKLDSDEPDLDDLR